MLTYRRKNSLSTSEGIFIVCFTFQVSSDKKSSKAAQLQERLSDMADLTSNDSVKDVLLHTKQNIVEMDSDNNLGKLKVTVTLGNYV